MLACQHQSYPQDGNLTWLSGQKMPKSQPRQQSSLCMHTGVGQAFMAPGGGLPMADRLAPGELDGPPPWPKHHGKDLPSESAI